jgi:hypothetical protein
LSYRIIDNTNTAPTSHRESRAKRRTKKTTTKTLIPPPLTPTIAMAATESRPRGREFSTPGPDMVHTPDAPRFGSFHDKGGPLSPRRSSRISGRTRERTPSPSRPTSAGTASPKKRTGRALAPALASPRKRPAAPDMVRRADGAVSSESKPAAPSVLHIAASAPPTRPRNSLLAPPRSTDMLPTPAKTPQQPDEIAKASVSLGSVSRTLFGHATPPSARRLNKVSRPDGELELEASVKVKIDIFTDASERVPEKDESSGNPFWHPAGRTATKSERVSRAKVWIPSEQRAISVNEASKRSDGQVRVFRGRKIWMESAPSDVDDDDDDEDEEVCIKFKPRRLFAPAPPKHEEKPESTTTAPTEEEDAPTDVEDNAAAEKEPAVATVTAELTVAASIPLPATPQPKKGRYTDPVDDNDNEAPLGGPLSPPDTRRVTRSMDKPRSRTARSPTRTSSSGGRSPAFAGFKISKPTHSAVSKAAKTSRKRPGDHLAPTEAKRTRA